MRKIKFLLSVIALLSVGVVSAQTAEEVTAKYNDAATKYNEKKFAEAIPLFEATIQLATASSDDVAETLMNAQQLLAKSNINYGASLASQKKVAEALPYFLKGNDLAELADPESVAKSRQMISSAYIFLGNELLKAEKYAEAADTFMKAVEKNDKDTRAALLAAQSYSRANNSEKAGEVYQNIIKLGDTHSKYAEAANTAKKAYSTDMLISAIGFAKDKKYDEAGVIIDKIIAIDSLNSDAWMTKLQNANNAKKYDDVINNADKALSVQATDEAKSNINFIVGAAYQVKENKAKAIESYKKVTAGGNVASAKQLVTDLSK